MPFSFIGILQPITETGNSPSENLQGNEQGQGLHIIPSPTSSPQSTRFKNAIDAERKELPPEEEISRDKEHLPGRRSRANHVTSNPDHSRDHQGNHLTFTQGSRKLHFPSRHTSRSDVPAHVISAHVHATPRTAYRKINGDAIPQRLAQLNRQASLPLRETTLSDIKTLRRTESFSGRRTGVESLRAHSQSARTAYEFLEANRRQYHKVKPKPSRQLDTVDVELGIGEDEERREEQDLDNKPWIPTGIYFAFLFTLWTAVLKIVDSVEKNGPVRCAQGEQPRLWACAGALALTQGIAEALWQRKSLFKALFSMACILTYMLMSHTQPLSCLLGEEMVEEITKWQAAMNCFISALLGALAYRQVQESVRDRKKKKKESRRRRRKRNQQSDDEDSFDGIPG